MMRKLSAVERERTTMRERKRREITTKIFQGLRNYGSYNLPPRADINEVLRALAEEVGWIVEAEGTTFRNGGIRESTSMCPYRGIVVPFTGAVNPSFAEMEALKKSSFEAECRCGGQGNPSDSSASDFEMISFPTLSTGTLYSNGSRSGFWSLDNCFTASDSPAVQKTHFEVKQKQTDESLSQSKIMESGEGLGKMSTFTGNYASAVGSRLDDIKKFKEEIGCGGATLRIIVPYCFNGATL